ncbi:hypothetical protein K432DRAFT_185812 [Lepidopterella palustris CBS 459.81]|uniref:Leucine-rich repeat domain-containing protein n=1 Tax=Lepidopterella palustris CBS 459.81 TaxID=1314670 RepID=A0A8E2E0E6_9PEZI|nr:hypothetical protein K432DRAFT_185812 [Lepidopterella palustris CBS 459.81]
MSCTNRQCQVTYTRLPHHTITIVNPQTKHSRNHPSKKHPFGTLPKTTVHSGNSTMATIKDLPNELLIEILSSIPKTEKKTFWSLCLTSKLFRALAEPLLYHSYQFYYQYNSPSLSFITSVANRPELALHVRSVVIDGWQLKHYPKNPQLGTQTQALLRQAAERFRYPPAYINKWKGDLSNSVDDARFALMLLLTAKLEELSLIFPSYDIEIKDPWFLRLVDKALDDPVRIRFHEFRHLKTLKVAYSEFAHGGFLLTTFAPLFRLPALRTFEATKCFQPNDMPAYHWPEKSSSMESITFHQSQLSREALHALLRACKGIKHFNFGWTCMVPLSEEPQHIDYIALDSSLRTQQHSLETLSLSFADIRAEELWAFDPNVIGSLRSLRAFPNLKSITVPVNALLDFAANTSADPSIAARAQLANLLPSSLERLRFVNRIYRHVVRFQQLQGFADHALGLFPRFKHLEVCSSDVENEDWTLLRDRLREREVVLVVNA